MQTMTEARHPGEVLLSEASGQRSRDAITIATGHVVEPGAVLGRITASGTFAPFDPTATDGRETAAAIAIYGADASAGEVQIAAITRDAEVRRGALVFAPGVDEAQQQAAMATLAVDGIIAR